LLPSCSLGGASTITAAVRRDGLEEAQAELEQYLQDLDVPDEYIDEVRQARVHVSWASDAS
jgi:hypothetical protein